MNYLFVWENNTLQYINTHFTCRFLDFLMPKLSFIGEYGLIWAITAIALLCMPKYREDGGRLAIALIMGGIVCNLILKPAVSRIRPFDINAAIELLINPPKDFSFPSGHTVSSFASVPVLWKTNKKFGIAALVLAILIAFSRLYLYVHYPTDILAGIAIGLILGFIASHIKFRKEV